MPEVSSYKNGVPCWSDLTTTDPDAAKSFYSDLFGWEVGEAGGPEVGGYTQFQQDGKPLCAVSKQQDQQVEMGIPPMWNSYVAADSADDTTAKAKEASGTVMAEPFDVMEFGRMSIIQDPTGAVFETWQAGSHSGAALVNEPVSMCWNELATRDVAAAGDFYSKTFGWETSKVDGPMDYYELKNNGDTVGGMMPMPDEVPDEVPSFWTVYFAVDDADATVEKAQELGGSVTVPPRDIPAGRFAHLRDAQGAAFAVIKLNG